MGAARTFVLGLVLGVLALTGCGAHHQRRAAGSTTPTPPAGAQRSTPAASGSAGASQPAGPVPALRGRHGCPHLPSFTCATLTVPLDHGGQAPGSLRLAVAVQAGTAPRGVLLFLTGGPGEPGVPFVGRVERTLHAALDGYRLVMFDQRGTGQGALDCPALQAAAGASDLIYPGREIVSACAQRIGPARRFYATAETVADIDALRGALGVSRLTVDGVSYGTFVAERYALRYPDHVVRLVLDSVVPQQGVDPLYRAAMPAVARVLRSVCRQQRCGWDPAAEVADLVRTGPDGPPLLAALVDLSVGQPQFPGVLDALHGAVRGERRALEALLAGGRRSPGVPASALSQGLHQSALCLELASPWDSAAPEPARAATLAEEARAVPAPALYPFTRATALGNGLAQGCLRWPATAAPNLQAPAPGDRLPSVPVLLLAGTNDLSTPLAWAEQEATVAPEGRLVVAQGAGHSVQLRARDPGVRAELARFLGSA